MKKSLSKFNDVAMSIINPQLCKTTNIQVELEQSGEGSVPHLHVYFDKSRNRESCFYIRLDKADYFTHHDTLVKMFTKDQKKEFIKIMESVWESHFIKSTTDKSNIKAATGYEAAVSIWNDTYGETVEFKYNDDGFPQMPDYNNLPTCKEERNQTLTKGIFWIKDTDDFTDNVVLTILVDAQGNVQNVGNLDLNSKKKDNYNHKLTWEKLEKKDTNNKPFDYYPRGRVEIKNGKAIIYASPYICGDELIEWCVEMFGLNRYNGISDVNCKADNSEHYKCYLDE
ncbi:MAG: hypothetical protein IJF94_03740 [Eubacterium sp.]|nr:hypothetical protein [Eubacterium sp.]